MALPGSKLTFKQKKFAKQYVKNKGNGVKSAMEAYDADYNGAKAIASQNLNKENIKNEIQRQLKVAGIDESYLGKKIFEGIEAGSGVNATQKDANNLINMALKLYNSYPTTKHARLNINVNSEVSTKNIDEVVELGHKSASNITSLLQIFKS